MQPKAVRSSREQPGTARSFQKQSETIPFCLRGRGRAKRGPRPHDGISKDNGISKNAATLNKEGAAFRFYHAQVC